MPPIVTTTSAQQLKYKSGVSWPQRKLNTLFELGIENEIVSSFKLVLFTAHCEMYLISLKRLCISDESEDGVCSQ